MEIEHLTVYYDSTIGFVVDNDHADNPNGTRNPGKDGAHFDTPEEAGAYVTERLRQMKSGN